MNNNPHRINQEYAAYFQSWFNEHITSSKKAFFVSLTFEHEAQRRCRRQAEGLSKGSFERDAFRQLYLMTARKLIGRNFHRFCHRDRLPDVVTFLDAEGSRHWKSAGDLINLHFHSIWLIEQDDAAAFKEVMDMSGSRAHALRALSFDQIDVRQLDVANEDEVKRVISYASKLIGFTNEELTLGGADFEVYPLPRGA